MATTQNRWSVGTMYFQGRLNGQPFYTQPDGPFGKVYPTQVDAAPWADFPIPGMIINEYNPWWSPECGHAIKCFKVIPEFDYDTNQSVALITCEICSYCQAVYTPFETWLNPVEHSIIVA